MTNLLHSDKNQNELSVAPSEALPAEKPAGFMQATKDFFGNALNTVKGKDLNAIVEDFSSEMTLVAEGLSEDQARLHELCQSVAAQQTLDREELNRTIGQMEEAISSADDRISTLEKNLESGIQKLQKNLDQLEKKSEEKKKHKLDNLSGLVRQLTILVGVAGGAWIIVTILNLFKG